MARRQHTGILNTNFPSTAEEIFRVSQYEENPDFMVQVEACEMRALAAMRQALKVRKTRRPSEAAGSVFVEVDSLKRPITYPRSREDHRQEREEFLARDLRKEAREKPVLLDIHELFRTVESFHRNWRDLEDARKWIAEDDNRRILTAKFGAGSSQVEKILSEHRQSFFAPEIREALERYELRWAVEKKSLVTKEQAESLSDPLLKRELLELTLESVPDDGGPDRKRVEAMKEIEHRSGQAQSLFGKIRALDQRIAVRPFEGRARIRNQRITQLRGGRRERHQRLAPLKRKLLTMLEEIRVQPASKGKPLSEIIRIARERFRNEHPDPERPDWPSEKTIYRWHLRAKKRRTSTKKK